MQLVSLWALLVLTGADPMAIEQAARRDRARPLPPTPRRCSSNSTAARWTSATTATRHSPPPCALPDVCLIDFNMPGMDGCEVARRLRAWRRGQPVYLIAVTAHGSDETREETAAAGFDLHLVKPADWDELSLALAELEQRLGRAECLSRARRVAGACRIGLSEVRP